MSFKIYIDPRARISYASYYIFGLYLKYEKRNVKFSSNYFSDLLQNNPSDDFDQYFSFVILEKGLISKRVVIDYRDKSTINHNALIWCDVYGKVNFNTKADDYYRLPFEMQKKIVPIGPNFGIKIWGIWETLSYLVINYVKSCHHSPVNFRTFFAGYHWQLKRQPYSMYKPSEVFPNYLFFISGLYPDKDSYRISTNEYRASFIRACKKINELNFEGGLLVTKEHPDEGVYKEILTREYVLPEQFIGKTRRSVLVFNTPAVWGCHGWKLGEYLAMGKAIISTPLLNEMPYPFLHGKHVHFVKNAEEIEGAVNMIIQNDSYRKKLENHARKYFEDFLAPEKVISGLVNYTPSNVPEH